MERIRALTLNLWGEQPPLERRMALVEAGIRALGPDVVALQEVRAIPGALANQAEALAARLGFCHAFAAATSWGGGEEGLAVLSPHPVAHADHRELPHATPAERRIVLGAELATPAGALAVFVTHLNYRLGDGAVREDQTAAVDAFAGEWAAARPSPLPRLLLGDFNATPDHDEIRFLRGLRSHGGRRAVWQDAWARAHPGERGWTWCRDNAHTARLAWLDRDRRIDYVFVSPLARDGRGEIHDCLIVLDQPDETGCCASDHYGVLAEIQVAPLW